MTVSPGLKDLFVLGVDHQVYISTSIPQFRIGKGIIGMGLACLFVHFGFDNRQRV